MIYKQEYKIKGKIIKKEILCDLIKEVTKKMKKEKIEIKNFEVSFKEGISIQDSNISLFNSNYFNTKRMEKLNIIVGINSYDNYVRIYTSGLSYGHIEITCTNKTIFDSICHSVEKAMTDMNNQKNIYLIGDSALGFISLLILTYMVDFIFLWLINLFFKNIINTMVIFFSIIMCSFVFLPIILKWIENNYPSIEYDFGDNSVNHPKKTKGNIIKIILFIITNFLIPFIVNIISKFFNI